MKTFRILFLFLFTFQFGITKAGIFKEIGVGGELIYNAPIAEPGIGLRAHLHSSSYLFWSPQVFYYPGIFNIHELYAGLSGNLKLFPNLDWTPYATLGGFYNLFINYASSPISNAQAHNFAFEGGAGFTKNFGCYRPFLEYRVNSKWWESNFRLGLVVYFGNCKKGGKGGSSADCPAFSLK